MLLKGNLESAHISLPYQFLTHLFKIFPTNAKTMASLVPEPPFPPAEIRIVI
jgi:hypothetical protein